MADDKKKSKGWFSRKEKPVVMPDAALSADGLSRRNILKASAALPVVAASGTAEAIIAPAAAELAAGAAPTAVVGAVAVAAPVSVAETLIPRAAAYMAPKMGQLIEMTQWLFDIDRIVPDNEEITNKAEVTIIESIFKTGLPLDQAGQIEIDHVESLDKFLSYFNDFSLHDNGVMRTLKLSEITPENIMKAFSASEEDQYYDFSLLPQHTIPRLINILKRITNITDEEITLGELTDLLSNKSIMVVKNVLAHPELMPENLSSRRRILRRLVSIMDNFVSYEDQENLTENAQLQNIVIEKVKHIDAEESKMRSERKQIDAEKKKNANYPISCDVLVMKPTEKGMEKGIQKSFLIKPKEKLNELNIPAGLTSAHIRRFCQQLKAEGKLDSNFRPASVETQWLGAATKDGPSGISLGMRVSTADAKLRRYLTQCAEKGQTIVIPAVSPHIYKAQTSDTRTR